MEITKVEDIYKLTLKLFDFLINTQQSELADKLAQIADDCYISTKDTLESYLEILLYVQTNAVNLPKNYLIALQAAIDLLKKQGP